MKRLFLVMGIILFSAVAIAGDQAALEKRLSYLKDIDGVAAVKFVRNNVYIGFKNPPADLGNIVRGAAVFGNRAYDARVHVWGCLFDDSQKDPQKWRYFCSATGQNGKVKKTNCR